MTLFCFNNAVLIEYCALNLTGFGIYLLVWVLATNIWQHNYIHRYSDSECSILVRRILNCLSEVNYSQWYLCRTLEKYGDVK